MIERVKDFKKGVYKVVGAQDVEEMTSREGWQLAAIMSEEVMMSFSEDAPSPNMNDMYATVSVMRQRPSACLSFLMWKDEESLLKERKEKIVSLEKEVKEFRLEVEDLNNKNKSHEGMITYLEGEKERLLEEIDRMRDVNKKMETDVGKVQEALGSQRMNEILKEEAK